MSAQVLGPTPLVSVICQSVQTNRLSALGSSIVSSAPVSFASTQTGNGTLVAGTLAVANTAITASSVVMVTQTGAAINATQALSVTLSAGVGFTVNGPTASVATFAYFIAKY